MRSACGAQNMNTPDLQRTAARLCKLTPKRSGMRAHAMMANASVPMDQIQLQPRLPLPVFSKHHGTEQRCQRLLVQARWCRGFVRGRGLTCAAAVAQAGGARRRTLVAAREHHDLSRFKWVNTMPVNLRARLRGSRHALDFSGIVQRCPAVFAYRFDCRVNVRQLPARFGVAARDCPPKREQAMRVAEVGC